MISHASIKMPDLTSRRSRFHFLTALNLLESLGVPLENIQIKTVGTYENYRGEIRSQEPEAGAEITRGTLVTLAVGSDSAVDFMPYQFFYGLQGIRDTDNTWEDRARCLMAPFDAAVIRFQARMRMHSLKNSFSVGDEEHLRRFMALFEYDPGYLEKSDDIKLLAALLPSLHDWGGNPVAVASVLERLTGFRVNILENVGAEAEIPADVQYKLGSTTGRLGCETIIGSTFEECDSTYEVAFVDVPPGKVGELLPGGKRLAQVERFLDFCMPGDLDYKVSVKVAREMDRQARAEPTRESDDASRAPAERTLGHLGYSTYI